MQIELVEILEQMQQGLDMAGDRKRPRDQESDDKPWSGTTKAQLMQELRNQRDQEDWREREDI